MKKLATTLTALVMATGLSMTAQAATKVTTTTKSTTTQKTVPAKAVKAEKVKVEKTTKTAVKTNRATTKTGKKTGEVNIDIPAELKIDESNNKTVVPATNAARVNPADTAVVVPVTQVTQTGPAVQSVSVQPVDSNTAIASTTTTVPVDVKTVPVVVNP